GALELTNAPFDYHLPLDLPWVENFINNFGNIQVWPLWFMEKRSRLGFWALGSGFPPHKEDPEEDPEEEPEEDVDIELEDDAELIFPYEVEGDKTPPPGDVSSDSESEDEVDIAPEVDVAPDIDVAPEATIGTSTQKPYAIRDFPRGIYEVGESSSARDSSYAELSTNQTEIALLKSKNKIGEKERELLNHDLENVERALGNVLERVSVLENGENATLKKRLAETETKLAWAYMERDITERRLHEIMPPKAMSEARMREVIREQVATCMAEFMANMNRGAGGDEAGGARAGGGGAGGARAGGAGAGGGGASGGGAGGAGAGGAGVGGAVAGGAGAGSARAGGAGVSGAGSAAPEITRCTYVTFMKCDPQPFKGTEGGKGYGDEFDLATLQGSCIDTWLEWNRIASHGMVEPEQVKVEQYIRGLSKNIRGDVTSSRPIGIDEAVHMAYQLMGQIIQDKNDEVSKGEKRKGCDYVLICTMKRVTKRDFPKLKKNGQGGNNRRSVYKLGAVDAQQDPKVVTGIFLLNNRYATALFDSGADKSFVSRKALIVIIGMNWLSRYDAAILCGEKKVRIPLEGKTLVIEGDRNNSRLKIISCIKARKYIEKGCELFLAQVTKQESKEKRLEDFPVIRDFPEVFPEELPGLPPPRQVEFRIDLIPGAALVARSPCCLAPSEMKDLSKQLQELSNKGFIRPSSSPWGAPVLFVKKQEGLF
ncbi:hypothetical protein Tco_0079989, partial [Tanacetum coccineum]